MKKWVLFVFIVLIYSCTTKPGVPQIHIVLIDSGTNLKIAGLNQAIMQDISRDSSASWQNLLQVYRMPADTDIKDYQPIQPGNYTLKDNAIVFKPDTPFEKNQIYFLRYFRYSNTADIWGFIKGKRQPGKVPYTDLIFKQ